MKPLLAFALLLVLTFHLSAADTAPDISEKAFAAATALRKAGKNAIATVTQKPDSVLVTVNGTKILTSDLRKATQEEEQEVRKYYADLPARLPPALAELKRKKLDMLIDNELLLQEFQRLGGILKPQLLEDDIQRAIQNYYQGDRAAFVAALARFGETEASYRAMIVRKLTIQLTLMRIAGEVEITLQEAREYYDQHKDRWSGDAEVKFHTVTLPKTSEKADAETRRQAEGLRTKLLDGADFATIARAWSNDSHAEKGGEWGWLRIAELTDAFREAVQKTKTGGIGEIIDQENSFILLRVDDYRAPPTPPFEKVQEDITQHLKGLKSKHRVDARLAQLRSEADIRQLAPAGK